MGITKNGRPFAKPGEQKAKRELIQTAKTSCPCPDCVIAEIVTPYGGLGMWPAESMTLDHIDRNLKTMWFSTGSDKSRRDRTGNCVPYTEFPIENVIKELNNAEPVCSNHQNIRTRLHNLAKIV